MKTRKEKLELKEVALKASMKTKGHKENDHSNSKLDEDEAQW